MPIFENQICWLVIFTCAREPNYMFLYASVLVLTAFTALLPWYFIFCSAVCIINWTRCSPSALSWFAVCIILARRLHYHKNTRCLFSNVIYKMVLCKKASISSSDNIVWCPKCVEICTKNSENSNNRNLFVWWKQGADSRRISELFKDLKKN